MITLILCRRILGLVEHDAGFERDDIVAVVPLLTLGFEGVPAGLDDAHLGHTGSRPSQQHLGLCFGLSLAFSLDPVFDVSLEEHCC